LNMVTTNNNEPSVVQDIRRARRAICGGASRVRYYKRAAHKNHRRYLKTQLLKVTKGRVHPDDFDDYQKRTCTLTSWDIW